VNDEMREQTLPGESDSLDVEADTQRQPVPTTLAPIDAYNRALRDLGIELDDLMEAITSKVADMTIICANDAVVVLLEAHAAYRRLTHEIAAAQATDANPLLDAVKLGLDERCRALLGLFDLAEKTFRDQQLLHDLANHRMGLQFLVGDRWRTLDGVEEGLVRVATPENPEIAGVCSAGVQIRTDK
jgi:hypothetical protein